MEEKQEEEEDEPAKRSVSVVSVVDPRFVRHFGLQIWKRAQEKEYFEQRKAYREWWWNHTVVLAWRCLTWSHAAVLFLGTLSLAKSLFWIRINWMLISLVAQSTCHLGEYVAFQCHLSGTPLETIQLLRTCPNATAPLTTRLGEALLFYNPAYYYTWIPQSLEQAVVGPFVVVAYYYRHYTAQAAQQWPWLVLTGVVCEI